MYYLNLFEEFFNGVGHYLFDVMISSFIAIDLKKGIMVRKNNFCLYLWVNIKVSSENHKVGIRLLHKLDELLDLALAVP